MPAPSRYLWEPGLRGRARGSHIWCRPHYSPGHPAPGLLLNWLSDDAGEWWAFVARLRDGGPTPAETPRAAVVEQLPAADVRAVGAIPPDPNSGGPSITPESHHVWLWTGSTHQSGLVLQRAERGPGTPIWLVLHPPVDGRNVADLTWATRDKLADVPSQVPEWV
ncbi:hypothetical protein [Nocardioides sp. J54]|uniref:hypothetical protein n=1 Tax=Nocardioides sp. J54 TaxID=935866 RepID=UPI0004916848|nr:hypothetical protein [Nocardioides sp. J54]